MHSAMPKSEEAKKCCNSAKGEKTNIYDMTLLEHNHIRASQQNMLSKCQATV